MLDVVLRSWFELIEDRESPWSIPYDAFKLRTEIIETAADLPPEDLASLPDDLCAAIDAHFEDKRRKTGICERPHQTTDEEDACEEKFNTQDRKLFQDLPVARPVGGAVVNGMELVNDAKPDPDEDAARYEGTAVAGGQYTTKDSGEKRVHASGMVRDQDQDKPAFHLILPKDVPFEDQMLTRLAALYTRGAVRYGGRNWELSCTEEDEEHIAGSLFRHVIHLLCGDTDEDHAAAVMWNVNALELARRNQRQA
jgi:hypothetical protein